MLPDLQSWLGSLDLLHDSLVNNYTKKQETKAGQLADQPACDSLSCNLFCEFKHVMACLGLRGRSSGSCAT